MQISGINCYISVHNSQCFPWITDRLPRYGSTHGPRAIMG
jgi:hypothetical protein